MKGFRRDQWGFRAYVKVGRFQVTKRFPPETHARVIQAWRDEARVALRKKQPEPDTAGTLKADVARYLEQVRAMPTFRQRQDHLQLWLDALGRDTPRASITPEQIRVVLHRWRDTLAPGTCNKRRSALMHLWTVLDGKGARNPVRDVPKFRVADPLPRGRDPHALDAALRAAPRCRSRASCRVMLWTGMRPDELDRAEPEDVDTQNRAMIVRTGKGGRTRVVPLTSQAVSAWKEFDKADAWHQVPEAAPLGRWLKQHTGLDALRVYDLRHSYGTALARRGTRLDVIGALMGHSTLELTRRYTLAAVAPDAVEATRRLSTAARTASSGRKSKKRA